MGRREYFLDTSYCVALSVAGDVNQVRARHLADEIAKDSVRLVTTRPILYEIGNSFSRRRLRTQGFTLIRKIFSDPSITVVSDTDERFAAALEMFANYHDKDWGLVDCLSFVVMAERQLTDALTADVHFSQAGYRALLRE